MHKQSAEIKKRGQKEVTETKQTSEIKVRKVWNNNKKICNVTQGRKKIETG